MNSPSGYALINISNRTTLCDIKTTTEIWVDQTEKPLSTLNKHSRAFREARTIGETSRGSFRSLLLITVFDDVPVFFFFFGKRDITSHF